MTDGQEISVLIEAQDEKFVGYLNGEVMEGVEMKYRYPLETAAKLRLWGGAAEDEDKKEIYWSTFTMPVRQHYPDPAEEDPMTDHADGSTD